MTVIDIHAHIYPEKIATRAVSSIAGFYNMSTEGEGTSEGLVATTANSPITNFVVHSVATSAHSLASRHLAACWPPISRSNVTPSMAPSTASSAT